MDHYGIGAAMRGVAQTYFRSARQTGRTTSMVESLKDGDRVVFLDPREAERVKRLCRERGINVECITQPPTQPESLLNRGTGQGRTIFDHSWVEARYLLALENVEREIDWLQKVLSGYGPAHRETRQAAMEIARWRT